ncbi:SAM-dependent methyltransferase [Imhoffiella purpurea]|uniref:Cobalt-precorrin-4 C11-methyltransferase n=1 Tax=Imhoffiella purpurea TaxID=1249627 RepID=W9V3W2_9GAMM|nr:SAM-dependent methyltransferase [Imhoffiella purpurea]EXJ14208.1 Cobalt-precorrin-4 C11-methyltransferase [Imhoffiella purpurea]
MISTSGVPRWAAIPLISSILLAGLPASAETDTSSTKPSGHLYLVSIGIGDPDNITVRAQKILAESDIVFGMESVRERHADLLQGKEIYEAGHGLFRQMPPRPSKDADGPSQDERAERRRRHEEQRAELEAQARKIIREAVEAGKQVAVIDYGDPTIYGPQTGYLSEFADLDPVVIPGVSSFNAANAALGRGITQGEHSRSVILTRTPGGPERENRLDTLEKLAESRSTLVFFTMRSKLPEVVERLKGSYPGDTPIAIVSHAGYAEREQVMVATLDTVLEQAGDAELPFEHLIYVGDFLK